MGIEPLVDFSRRKYESRSRLFKFGKNSNEGSGVAKAPYTCHWQPAGLGPCDASDPWSESGLDLLFRRLLGCLVQAVEGF